jgi:glycosyltransferase involved in cell wall biosynthesis
MLQIIYIGNKLSKHGYTPTSIETLGERLKELFHVKQYSDQRVFLFRILTMFMSVLFASKNSIVIIDTYSSKAFLFSFTTSLACKIRAIPYITVLRGGNLPERMKTSPGMSRFVFRNSKANISPSNYLKKSLKEILDIESKLIPNYIDIINYPYQSRKFEKIKLLWVRAFHSTYNPSLAIEIISRLHEHGYTDSELCMVGPDKDGSIEEVKSLIEKNRLEKNVKLTGRLSKKDWISLSQNYNIFINTTNFDNTPVSVMEAMALGLPIISTSVGGVPFIIREKDNGFLVPPNNAEAFVDKILWIKDHEAESAEISKNARKDAENWDWKRVKEEWKQIIES